jgi:hypothetical protein
MKDVAAIKAGKVDINDAAITLLQPGRMCCRATNRR